MTALIERVRTQRTQVDIPKAAATVALFPFVALGWCAGRVFAGGALVLSWTAAAVVTGWTAGR